MARANLARAGVADRVEIASGRALDLLAGAGEGPFDLVFIDADKGNNAEYFDWALRLSRPGTADRRRQRRPRRARSPADATDAATSPAPAASSTPRRRAARGRHRDPDRRRQGLGRLRARRRRLTPRARRRPVRRTPERASVSPASVARAANGRAASSAAASPRSPPPPPRAAARDFARRPKPIPLRGRRGYRCSRGVTGKGAGMAVPHYGVLRGRVLAGRREDGRQSPHYQVHVLAAGTHYRLAVNVKSQTAPSELLFHVDEDFRHPLTAALEAQPDGFLLLGGRAGLPALDYVRGGLLDPHVLRPLPASGPGRDDDLGDAVGALVARAAREPGAGVHAFGSRWGPEPGKRDQVFGFLPGNGIHNVHMNQGNEPGHSADDGAWQDGGLLFRFAGRWVALFLAFQSQRWRTDDATGRPLPPDPSGA